MYVGGDSLDKMWSERRAATKVRKFEELVPRYIFTSVVFETVGCAEEAPSEIVEELGRKVGPETGDRRAGEYLWLRLVIAIQRRHLITSDHFCIDE